MTNLPKDIADRARRRLSAVHQPQSSKHKQPTTARKSCCSSWPTADEIECVLLRDGDAPHDLHQHAGRLRHGLRVLRERARRRRPQSDGRRNRRTDAAARIGCCRADERLSHIVVMGMGEPLANLDQLCCPRSTRPPARPASASAPGGSRSRPSACRRRSIGCRARTRALQPGRVAARPRRRAAQRNSCR